MYAGELDSVYKPFPKNRNMILIFLPALDHALVGGLELVQRGLLLILLGLLLVGDELHPDLLGDHGGLRVGTRFVVLREAELGPVFPGGDGLGHHLADNFVGSDNLDFLAVVFEGKVGDDLGVSLYLLPSCRLFDGRKSSHYMH